MAQNCGVLDVVRYLLPRYCRTAQVKHTMAPASMWGMLPSVGNYMGISIYGGKGVKGIDLLLHCSIELIGRGEVGDPRGKRTLRSFRILKRVSEGQ